MGVLLLHLGRVVTQVRVLWPLSNWYKSEQGVKKSGQGARPSRTPSHASQDQAATSKRWDHKFQRPSRGLAYEHTTTCCRYNVGTSIVKETMAHISELGLREDQNPQLESILNHKCGIKQVTTLVFDSYGMPAVRHSTLVNANDHSRLSAHLLFSPSNILLQTK